MAKDLVVLVADKNIDYGVQGLLSRPAALQIRPIQADTFVHPRRDPGCLREAQDFLRRLFGVYTHALIMFDRMGSGREALSQEELSEEVHTRVAGSGWGDRADVIILDPEIESWVFATSPQVERCVGWPPKRPTLRSWLETQGLWEPNSPKPADPKEALEQVLRRIKKPRSSALYMRLGERVNFRHCTDPAFVKFRTVLSNWFPAAVGK